MTSDRSHLLIAARYLAPYLLRREEAEPLAHAVERLEVTTGS
jgi:hypothetical protein